MSVTSSDEGTRERKKARLLFCDCLASSDGPIYIQGSRTLPGYFTADSALRKALASGFALSMLFITIPLLPKYRSVD
jgi:hypothetical protein